MSTQLGGRACDAEVLLPCARVAATAVLFVSTVSTNALAYRPFDGTDAEVAAPGDFEAEVGPLHLYSQGSDRYFISPATVLNLGLVPRVELVADFQHFLTVDAVPGVPRGRLLDTDILVKALLVRGSLQGAGEGPSVAAELGPLLPNLNDEHGYGASCAAIVSQRWSALTLHLNSRLELSRADLNADWFESLIVEGPLDAPARPVGELFVERELVAGLTTWSGLVGAIWRARDGLDLDVGLRIARIGDERATEVRLGFTWTVGVWAARD
jgi:hypothetical protein